MKYIKTGIAALLLFVIAFVVGAYLSIDKYPRKEFQRITKSNIQDVGSEWKFIHKKEIITSDFKTVVKPAVDFLYSSATLNGELGAYVLSIPPIDRYFVFQFMEDDTDVFDYIGSRTYGMNKPLEVLITPPNYEGETFGLKTVELKTNKTWLLARFQIFDKEDAVNIHNIQDKISFTPIAEYQKQSL